MGGSRKPRIVVCGTVFGQVYLEALSRDISLFEFAGILARGSARAKACAEHYRVPLFTSVDELPNDIDAACVVVRSGVLGGQGSEVVQALLDREIHVLQEHPVHPDELARSLRLARKKGRIFQVNAFYPHLLPVRRLIAAVAELSAVHSPLYADIACGAQLTYSSLEILVALLPSVRPWTVTAAPVASAHPFRLVSLLLAGTPITLRVHNELDPADPDGHSLLLHDVSIGFAQGRLLLPDTHGPLLWSPRPTFPKAVRNRDSQPFFAQTIGLDQAFEVLGPTRGSDYDNIFSDVWSRGVQHALGRFRAAIEAEADPLLVGRRQLAVAELWRDLATALGPPKLVSGKPAQKLSSDHLQRLRVVAGSA
jgi:pyochelin biosynthetic protein PchG